jgi:hypothetical protein
MRAHVAARIAGLALLGSIAGCSTVTSITPPSTATSAATSPSASSAPSAGSSPTVTAAPSSPASTAAAAAGHAPLCSTGNLKISVVRGGAATGAVEGQIGFTNLGSAPCQLTGYPAVAGVTAAGGQTLAGHLLTTEFGPNITSIPVVTLDPKATAIAVVTGNSVAGTCASGTIRTFRNLIVTPPGNADSVTLSAWLPSLAEYLPACGSINVTPVVEASSMPPL